MEAAAEATAGPVASEGVGAEEASAAGTAVTLPPRGAPLGVGGGGEAQAEGINLDEKRRPKEEAEEESGVDATGGCLVNGVCGKRGGEQRTT